MKRKEKLIGLFMVLFTMISVNAWAGSHNTHYGKVTVTSNGNGSVYVSTSQTAPDPNSEHWKESNELVLNCNGSSNNDSKTYYLHAKPNKGYRFVKWEGEGKSNYTSTSQRHTQTLKGTEKDPNTDSFTANFELIPTYISTAIVVPSANGKVYVSKSNTAPTEYSSETIQDSTHTVVYGSVPKHTYYYYAQPNNDEEYEFVGWSTSADGNIESSNNPYAKEIASNTGDGTTVTLYAIFAQKVEYYTKLNAVGGVGGSVNITSTSDITTEAIENGMSASSVSKQANAQQISYTLVATPESGYQFSGWYRDAALSTRASQNASYSVSIDGKTDVAEATQTYYAKFEQLHDYYKHVYAKAVGEGLVYLGTSNRNISDDAYTTVYDIPNHDYQVNAPGNTTYYWIAKEVDGYNFKGWYNNEACEGDPVSTSTSYNKSISASVDEDVVNALYAKFVPYAAYYSSVTVKVQEGGVVFVGNGETQPDLEEYGVEKTYPQSSVSKSAPSHSYTLYAQANPGYEFVGWRLNNNTNNASTNNQYTVSFNANSTNEAEPTSRTYTAVFAKKGIWNWEKPTIAAGEYYIYNPAADKFLGNANNGVDAEEATLWTLTDNSGTWKISEGENHIYVDRTGGSVDWSWNPQLDPQKFTAYSSGSKATSETCSDVFWVKGSGEYTFNTYLKWFDALIGSNDRSGDVYIGLNGANLSTSTENNAQKWYFVTEAEMEAYKEYVAAYNRAVEIVTEIPEWGETKNTLNGIINANVPSQLSTSDANIAALNSIIKVTLSVKAGKYSTIITPFEIELPEGITAYTSSSVNPSALSVNIDELVSGNEMLPADRPVILKNTTGSDIAKTYYGTSTKEEPVTEGVLIGYYTKGKIVPNGYYSLQTKSGVQQFYPIRQDDYHSAANKCYLIVPDGEELANVRIALDSEETSIDTIANLMNDSEYYSVNGVKLSAPKKGVNIVKMSDGSINKVFVK